MKETEALTAWRGVSLSQDHFDKVQSVILKSGSEKA
jgi:hypothetical protein